jgi:hypothetical protein
MEMQIEKTKWNVLKLNRTNHVILYREKKKLIDMLLLSVILYILLAIIDPSQKVMTIRINSVYLVDKRPKLGPPQDQDGDILGDLGKYTIHVYGTLSFDEGF